MTENVRRKMLGSGDVPRRKIVPAFAGGHDLISSGRRAGQFYIVATTTGDLGQSLVCLYESIHNTGLGLLLLALTDFCKCLKSPNGITDARTPEQQCWLTIARNTRVSNRQSVFM